MRQQDEIALQKLEVTVDDPPMTSSAEELYASESAMLVQLLVRAPYTGFDPSVLKRLHVLAHCAREVDESPPETFLAGEVYRKEQAEAREALTTLQTYLTAFCQQFHPHLTVSYHPPPAPSGRIKPLSRLFHEIDVCREYQELTAWLKQHTLELIRHEDESDEVYVGRIAGLVELLAHSVLRRQLPLPAGKVRAIAVAGIRRRVSPQRLVYALLAARHRTTLDSIRGTIERS